MLYENSNVGENLQDHVYVPLGFEAARGEVTFESLRNEINFAEAVAEYTVNHTGPLASRTSNAYISFSQILQAIGKGKGSILKKEVKIHLNNSQDPYRNLSWILCQRLPLVLQKLLNPGEANTQEVFLPGALAPASVSNASALFAPEPTTYPGNYFSMLAVFEHPFSRGSVHITSLDITVYPAIDPNNFSHHLDLYVISQAMLYIQQVPCTAPLSTHLKDGGHISKEGFYELNDENMKVFVKKSFTSEYHPMGTCAMGPRDQGGVIDERLVVHGTSNSRVVDTNFFPLQVRGNLASLVYAVAEMAADFIKVDARG